MGGGSTQTLYEGRKRERGQGVGFVPVVVVILQVLLLVLGIELRKQGLVNADTGLHG